MIDINGNEVNVGDKCKFYSELRDEWIIGTVRKVATYTYYNSRDKETAWEAKVDNGEPSNPDIGENGCTMAAMVESNRIEIIK